jgi:signal-transduction protein with cAMP-binding, CBS, and nucleotidyltransferase domain
MMAGRTADMQSTGRGKWSSTMQCVRFWLVGLFSERDYARKIILQGRVSRETPVYEVMTSPAEYVTPEETIDECLRIMTKGRVRHLPVVENGRVAGIISIGDMVTQSADVHRS